MIKALIFDFDGTLANTLPFTFSKIIELAKKLKVKDFKEKEIIEKIRSLSPQELFSQFSVSWLKMPLIIWEIKKAQKDLYDKINKIKIFPGIKKLLKELKKKGIKIYIYSSNLKKNIVRFLEKEKINQYFENVYVGRNLLGKDKDLLNILKKEGLKTDEVYYIADEIRDILACQKAKIKMIGVSWGLAKSETLKKAGADLIIKKPSEILKIIIV
jgi:HAD superfamily hydrolase (TIGR01549 family)